MFTQRFPLAVSNSFFLVAFSAKLLFFPLGAAVSVRRGPLWSAIVSRYGSYSLLSLLSFTSPILLNFPEAGTVCVPKQ
jgi:hypothetical protein